MKIERLVGEIIELIIKRVREIKWEKTPAGYKGKLAYKKIAEINWEIIPTGHKSIGEEWNFEIKVSLNEPPTLWIKLKTIDYEYLETKPYIQAWDYEIEELIIAIEEGLGTPKNTLVELQATLYQNYLQRKNLMERFIKSLTGRYATR